jgi:hypothetical protein
MLYDAPGIISFRIMQFKSLSILGADAIGFSIRSAPAIQYLLNYQALALPVDRQRSTGIISI